MESLICGNDTNGLKKQKETHRLRKQTYGCRQGMDRQGVWEGHIHTAVFKMNNQQGHTVQHMEVYPCYVPAWMGRGLGENGYMYVYG